MKPIDNPKPPSTLSKNSTAYFKKFVDFYEVDDSSIEVLIRICQSMDRADEAAAALKKHGSLLSVDRFGVDRAHPLFKSRGKRGKRSFQESRRSVC
jgi:phage terminase small subunit